LGNRGIAGIAGLNKRYNPICETPSVQCVGRGVFDTLRDDGIFGIYATPTYIFIPTTYACIISRRNMDLGSRCDLGLVGAAAATSFNLAFPAVEGNFSAQLVDFICDSASN
jgi:hypothetical protein